MLQNKVVGYFIATTLLVSGWFGGTVVNAKEEKVEISQSKVQYEDLSSYFTSYDGSFVLYDLTNKQYTIYNKEKSEKRVSPNSTFKIPHALIGLQTGVLKDKHTTFAWDGTVYPFPAWNQDQDLTSAIPNSTIWYFQEVARRVGEKKEQRYLHLLRYGNRDISGGLTNFWLQSSLEISPIEQVDFLKRFYTNQLPISKRNIDIVKRILMLGNKEGATLSGKTGTGWRDAVINSEAINGYFIGYVEKDGHTYFFATNLEADGQATGGKAKAITLQILKDKHIY